MIYNDSEAHWHKALIYVAQLTALEYWFKMSVLFPHLHRVSQHFSEFIFQWLHIASGNLI